MTDQPATWYVVVYNNDGRHLKRLHKAGLEYSPHTREWYRGALTEAQAKSLAGRMRTHGLKVRFGGTLPRKVIDRARFAPYEPTAHDIASNPGLAHQQQQPQPRNQADDAAAVMAVGCKRCGAAQGAQCRDRSGRILSRVHAIRVRRSGAIQQHDKQMAKERKARRAIMRASQRNGLVQYERSPGTV